MYFQLNSADLLDHIEVRRACQEVMTFYEEAGVRWTVCGWFKPGIAPGAEVAKEPKMHVTCIRPDISIQGALRYRCPAPPAVPEQVLHLNFPAVAGRAGRGNAGQEVTFLLVKFYFSDIHCISAYTMSSITAF